MPFLYRAVFATACLVVAPVLVADDTSRTPDGAARLNAARRLDALAAHGPALDAKTATVHAARAQEAKDATNESTRPRYVQTATSAGVDCASAVTLGATGFETHLASVAQPESVIWLRWNAPAAGTWIVSTRGSDIDTLLERRTDCARDSATDTRADDDIGLQAELALTATEAGQQFLLRASNTGAAGTLAVDAVAATRTARGRVTRSRDGQPVANLLVGAIDVSGFPRYIGGAFTDATGNWTWAQTTSSTTPSQIVFRTMTGYREVPKYVMEAYDDVKCLAPEFSSLVHCVGTPTTFTIGDGETVTGVDLVLDDGHSVRGRILDAATGAPLQYAYVGLWSGTQSVQYTSTDEYGRYHMPAVADATYRVVAGAAGYQTQRYPDLDCPVGPSCDVNIGEALVVAGADRNGIDFALRRAPTIELDVRLDGKRFSGEFDATLYAPDGSVAQRFERIYYYEIWKPIALGPLAPGTYRLEVEARFVNAPGGLFKQLYGGATCETSCAGVLDTAMPITIGAIGDVRTVTVDFVRWPTLKGIVFDRSGQPIAGAEVNVSSGNIATTNAQGAYAFVGIPPGDTYVQVHAPEHADRAYPGVPCEVRYGASECPGAQTLAFGIHGDRNVDFVLDPNGSIAGRARVVGGGHPYNVPAIVTADDQEYRNVWWTIDQVTGEYRVTDLPPGAAYRAVYADGAYAYQAWPARNCEFALHFTDCAMAQGEPIAITSASAVTGIDFSLLQRGARIVRVLDGATGQPLAGVAVDAWLANGTRQYTKVSGADGLVVVNFGPVYGAPLLFSTDNYLGFLNQVHAGIECTPGASVFAGNCALAGGASVAMPAPSPNLPDIVFRLSDGDRLFIGDFE